MIPVLAQNRSLRMDSCMSFSGKPDWSSELARHGRWLRAVLLARSRDRPAVEELFQEVALAAVRSNGQPLPSDRIAPWLYRIAVRQALLHRRKLGRGRRLRMRYEQNCSTESDSPDPLKWLLANERSRLIRQALDCLPTRDSEILLLKYTEDWSCRDIAAHLGLSERAVDSRLHRARGRLRGELMRRQVIEVPT